MRFSTYGALLSSQTHWCFSVFAVTCCQIDSPKEKRFDSLTAHSSVDDWLWLQVISNFSSLYCRSFFFALIFWSTLCPRSSLRSENRGALCPLPSVWLGLYKFGSDWFCLFVFRRKNSQFRDGEFTVEDLCQLSKPLINMSSSVTSLSFISLKIHF